MIKYIFLILFVAISSQANEDSPYAEIARLRQYASGADESDLKIQPVLSQSLDKKKKKIKLELEPTEGF